MEVWVPILASPCPQIHCTVVERALPCSGLPVGKPHPHSTAWFLLGFCLVFFGNLYIVPKFSRFLECQNGMKHLCICPDRGELPTAPHPALSWLLGEHKSTKSKLLLSEDDDG